jgi:hypothetical protein
MQKVVGSNPIIRSPNPLETAGFSKILQREGTTEPAPSSLGREQP